MKALVGLCERIEEFPPGLLLPGQREREGLPALLRAAVGRARASVPKREPYDPAVLRKALEDAVHRQLMCDVPYGLLISGGVDSSVIAAIAARFRRKAGGGGGPVPGLVAADATPSRWGCEGAPDLAPARKVAEHIGAIHHEIHFTIQEGLDALSDVIYHLETFDVTTIRASTPMYLLMRKIQAMGIKMVLSGEGRRRDLRRLPLLPQGPGRP